MTANGGMDEQEIYGRISVDDVTSMVLQAELLTHERHLIMQCLDQGAPVLHRLRPHRVQM